MNKENKRKDVGVPNYEYRKLLFKECEIAGVSFHIEKYDELRQELKIRTKLALVREKANTLDLNAVAVVLAEDYNGNQGNFDLDFILGYIPQPDNVELARMMDAGYGDKFSAEITALNLSDNYPDQIRISIFIESNEPELIRPNLLRAETFPIEELREMVADLEEHGMTYIQVIHDKLQYPIKGEKIVAIHNEWENPTLYLMRIIAAGKIECIPFFEDRIAFNSSDSCIPLILTNVMGPITVKSEDLEFLDYSGMSFFASEYLSPRLSECFESLFRSERDSILINMDPEIQELIRQRTMDK